MKCQSRKVCFGDSTARWIVQHYNGEIKRICDQCYMKDQIDIAHRTPMLETIGTDKPIGNSVRNPWSLYA